MGARVYVGGFILALTIRIIYRWRARHQVDVRWQITRREYLVLSVAFMGILVIPLLHLITDVFARAAYDLPAWATWLGTALFVSALWLLWRSHADLGRNWSETVVVRQNHQLITDGVYTHIRHPMYAAFLLWGIAQPLLLQNGIAGWSHLAAMLVLYGVRVPHEEALMTATFGAAYRTYMQRTGRILPRLRRPS